MLRSVILILLFSTAITPAFAACTDSEHRQFDFWLGEWQVSNSSNNQVSNSKISLINNGCGILEEYATPSGYQGKSLNIFNQQTKQWHQTWIDNTGLLLQLDGGFQQGKMVMTGKTKTPKGEWLLNKISWQLLDDGRVNQVWQTSKDNGKSWKTAFDGYYLKQK